jgi:DNA polymerase-1
LRVVLIDGDTLVYTAAAHSEYECQWDADLWTLHSNLGTGIDRLQELTTEIVEGLKAERVVIALSDDKDRWRPRVMPSYKAHRKASRKPIIYRPLREYMMEEYEVFIRPSLEGDDVLGILLTHPTLIEGEKILVSIDKDMKTLPGLHLNYDHARGADDYEAHIRKISVEEADRFHMYQTLTGDKTDGYPGCPGIGPVRAERILDDGYRAGGVWSAVLGAYQKAGLGEEAALQNARVARILRHTDYDFKKKEVKLWTPNQ